MQEIALQRRPVRERTRALVDDVIAATEEDWFTEYLAPVLAIKVVDGLDEAITHINHYGSHHTDAIVTEDISRARRVLRATAAANDDEPRWVHVDVKLVRKTGLLLRVGLLLCGSTFGVPTRGPCICAVWLVIDW